MVTRRQHRVQSGEQILWVNRLDEYAVRRDALWPMCRLGIRIIVIDRNQRDSRTHPAHFVQEEREFRFALWLPAERLINQYDVKTGSFHNLQGLGRGSCNAQLML
jgi:hypothetical protein